jgi:hypothetical protein
MKTPSSIEQSSLQRMGMLGLRSLLRCSSSAGVAGDFVLHESGVLNADNSWFVEDMMRQKSDDKTMTNVDWHLTSMWAFQHLKTLSLLWLEASAPVSSSNPTHQPPRASLWACCILTLPKMKWSKDDWHPISSRISWLACKRTKLELVVDEIQRINKRMHIPNLWQIIELNIGYS